MGSTSSWGVRPVGHDRAGVEQLAHRLRQALGPEGLPRPGRRRCSAPASRGSRRASRSAGCLPGSAGAGRARSSSSGPSHRGAPRRCARRCRGSRGWRGRRSRAMDIELGRRARGRAVHEPRRRRRGRCSGRRGEVRVGLEEPRAVGTERAVDRALDPTHGEAIGPHAPDLAGSFSASSSTGSEPCRTRTSRVPSSACGEQPQPPRTGRPRAEKWRAPFHAGAPPRRRTHSRGARGRGPRVRGPGGPTRSHG